MGPYWEGGFHFLVPVGGQGRCKVEGMGISKHGLGVPGMI